MSNVFIVTLIFVFLTISVESVNFILQWKGKKLTRWLGQNAFKYHAVATGLLWAITFCLMVALQFKRHPLFHQSIILKHLGLILLIGGAVLALWGFKLLGWKRSLGLNFFEENVPGVKESIYKYVKNPEDYGLWMILLGFALLTRSTYNLVIGVEFIVLMIPHIMLESRPLRN
jgi:protein-S-isoprenylcysteine O-methyltransferase Ste14